MTTYLVTGATGFLGAELVGRLLSRPDARVLALVRPASQGRLAAKLRRWPKGHEVEAVLGDLSQPLLGLSDAAVADLAGTVDHLFHLAAVYDMTADDDANEAANVAGTANVVALANRLGVGTLHHTSSVAVAGEYPGLFTEEMFDEGQHLPSAYHRTKFEAERIVRDEASVPWRVYRPAIVVGDSRTGEIDKIDGPYYLFELIRRLSALPGWARFPGPDLGCTNVVPVDYVVDAMDHLAHAEGLDGRAFHLVNPTPQRVHHVFNAFAAAAGAPKMVPTVGRLGLDAALGAAGFLGRIPGVELARDVTLDQVGIPLEVLPHVAFASTFDSAATESALDGSGIEVPDLRSYAPNLWSYWADHLDRDRARRGRPGGKLAGRRVVITGASSGIGRSTALLVAQHGGVPILVARRAEALDELRGEIERAGGQAWVYACDITDEQSVDTLVKSLLADHDGIDMLVNNAGRSIRRSVKLSYDRFHDYERTMALNYFGAVRLILGLLPHMTERRFGHIVNISSIGVQANPPRFSAYVASKAALDAFSRVVATETFGDGVTFTNVHMPLVRTPMIGPTTLYDAFPTLTPDAAAELVVEALVERPKTVNTRLGTSAEVLHAVAPKLADEILHIAYRVFPDSAAAKGRTEDRPTDSTISRAADALMRLLPGVHW